MGDVAVFAAAPDIDWPQAGTEMQLSTITERPFSVQFLEAGVIRLRYGEDGWHKNGKGCFG